MTNGHRRIFAGTELAARIERAERSLITESALAAGRRDPGGRCFATTLAGGVVAWAGEGSPLNKVAGLGFGFSFRRALANVACLRLATYGQIPT
ncbi:MAG TPA: hypothetical protein VIJ91_09490 [Candidatus Dormibacteraeota bacterium]